MTSLGWECIINKRTCSFTGEISFTQITYFPFSRNANNAMGLL